jgi:hypothetical protein
MKQGTIVQTVEVESPARPVLYVSVRWVKCAGLKAGGYWSAECYATPKECADYLARMDARGQVIELPAESPPKE